MPTVSGAPPSGLTFALALELLNIDLIASMASVSSRIYRRTSPHTRCVAHEIPVEDVGRIRNDISVESRRLPHTLPLGHGTHRAIAGLSDNNS